MAEMYALAPASTAAPPMPAHVAEAIPPFDARCLSPAGPDDGYAKTTEDYILEQFTEVESLADVDRSEFDQYLGGTGGDVQRREPDESATRLCPDIQYMMDSHDMHYAASYQNGDDDDDDDDVDDGGASEFMTRDPYVLSAERGGYDVSMAAGQSNLEFDVTDTFHMNYLPDMNRVKYEIEDDIQPMKCEEDSFDNSDPYPVVAHCACCL